MTNIKALFCCLLKHRNLPEPIVFHVRAKTVGGAKGVLRQHLLDEHEYSVDQLEEFEIDCQQITEDSII